MTTNVGTIDRVFRFVLGLVLIAAPFVSGMALFQGTTATAIAIVLGLVMLVTSALKFCPIYRIFGLQTCSI